MNAHPALYRPVLVQRNAQRALVAHARALLTTKPSLWRRLFGAWC